MKKSILILIFLFISPSAAFCERPVDQLKKAIDQVIDILKDPAYAGSTRESRHKKIMTIINNIFDFKEMAKRILARNWNRFTSQEQKEFSALFGEFLSENYLGKIQKEFKGEKVVYLGEEILTAEKASIKTKIIRSNVEIPVDYSMLLRDNTWRVYDVKIENVSLLKNYRSQFSEILLKKTPSQLIKLIKDKLG